MSSRKRQEADYGRRLRLMYSFGDFQLASSAAAFLWDCDSKEKYSLEELRRFRCYETTMITAYARPFSESKGKIPRLSLGMIGVKLSDKEQGLHNRLIELRNKVVAHSDADMMRMVSKSHPIKIDEDFRFIALETVFNEGLTFLEFDLYEVQKLISMVMHTVYRKLYEEAQGRPEEFNLRKDYLP